LLQGTEDYSLHFDDVFLFLYYRQCVQMGQWIPKGEWTYDDQTRQVRSSKVDKCVVTDGKILSLEKCKKNSDAQKWIWTATYVV
jgi:hypothetical protein